MRILLLAVSVTALFLIAQDRNDTSAAPQAVPMLEGLIKPFTEVEITSAADGLLETVDVDRGDIIQKGDVVARLESSVQKATLDLATAKAAAVGQLKTREARLAYSTAKLAQDEALFKKGLISALEIETSRTDKQVADAAVVEATENRRLAELERAQAQASLDLRTIRSTINGVVVERYLSPGELLTRQSDKKILKLAQISPLKVEVIVEAEYFGKIQVGQTATVTPAAPINGTYEAKVTVVDRVIDAASGTFEVRLEIPNEDGRLPSGLQCKVKF